MIRYLAISGGGVRGIAFIGALKQIWHKLDLIEIVGSSIGAFIAVLIAIGYMPDELYHIFLKLNLAKLENNNIFSIITEYGIDDGTNLLQFFKNVIKKKVSTQITFADLPTVSITTTNLTKYKVELYNYKTTPKMRILDALRRSVAYPIKFTPVNINGEYFVDGGVLCPYPIQFLPNGPETIGLLIKDNYSVEITDFEMYLGSYIMMCMHELEKNCLVGYEKQTITIDLSGHNSLNFNLGKKEKQEIYVKGQRCAALYIIRQLLH